MNNCKHTHIYDQFHGKTLTKLENIQTNRLEKNYEMIQICVRVL